MRVLKVGVSPAISEVGASSPSYPSDPDKGPWFNQLAQLRSGMISLKDKGHSWES